MLISLDQLQLTLSMFGLAAANVVQMWLAQLVLTLSTWFLCPTYSASLNSIPNYLPVTTTRSAVYRRRESLA